MSLVHFKPMHSNFATVPFGKFNNWPFNNLTDFVGNEGGFTLPSVNISETATAYHIELAAPGLNKDHFTIDVERNLLTVAARRQTAATTEVEGKTNSPEVSNNPETEVKTEPGKARILRREFNFSDFERSFKLPNSADVQHIAATYTDGILNVTVPKKASEAGSLKTRVNII
jgi:HSP20 family protein